MNVEFVNFCREVLVGGAPWFVIVVLVAYIALRRSIKVSLIIGESKPSRRRD
jgi:hypothetical protein